MSSEHSNSSLPEWLRTTWATVARYLPVMRAWFLKAVLWLRDLVARYPLTAVGAMLGFLVGSILDSIPLIRILTLGLAPAIGACVGGYLGWRHERRR